VKNLYIALNVLLICACGFATPISPTQVPEITSVFQQITPPQQPLKVIGIVKAETLELRQSPGGNRIGYLYKNDTVILLGNLDRGTPDCKAGWYLIDGGYVCAEFIRYNIP
jgi:hypothetical protein